MVFILNGCASYRVYEASKHNLIEKSIYGDYPYLDETLVLEKKRIMKENEREYLLSVDISRWKIIKSEFTAQTFAALWDGLVGWGIKSFLDKNL